MENKASGAERILHHGRSSLRPRFIQPVVIKEGNLFLLCTDAGDILPQSDQGLYFHDMRYLSEQAMRLNGVPLVSLLANASEGWRAVFELTNPDIEADDGSLLLRKETLGIRREKRLGDTYTEVLQVRNYAAEPAKLTLWFGYGADFADMFHVRGAAPGKRGTLHPPRWSGSTLTFQYDGADGHQRRTKIRFSQKPDQHDQQGASFHLVLKPQARWELTVTVELTDTRGGALESRPGAAQGAGVETLRRVHQGEESTGMRVDTDNALFNAVLRRSFLDLRMLAMQQKQQAFFAAGVPWYVALFGRDSLVTAIQMAPFEPEMAGHTLRVLAAHQGTKVDDWRDEQPGKVLHELRVGEMANLDEIPQTPYYGSVDSTPLFLVLLGIASTWSGSLDLFHELKDAVHGALTWIEEYGDSDGDGFIDYKTRSSKGLRNQGWKDSGNAIVLEDGQLAEPPIALPEVQGAVYLAWTSLADLFERDGDDGTARRLRERAQRLYEAFNRDFWLPDERYYALCRQADGRMSRSIASNPAHALWTGIIAPEHAGDVVQRVLKPDMFSGWGIRTLSANHPAYNPIDYQVGSVWPHDTAFIVAGMQRYGYLQEAARVFSGVLEAATRFEHFRLPETFAGYDTDYSSVPVKYPVACNPQAWAAGALPFMLQTMLGLRPDAFNRRLRIDHPFLPERLGWVHVRDLCVGAAAVDLRYERAGAGTVVAVERTRGDLEVVVTR